MTTTKKGQMLHKKSNVFGRVPSASTLGFGEIAVNYNEKEPFLAIKTSGETNNFEVVKISSDKIIEQKINDAVDKVDSELNELADIVSENEFVTAYSLTELNEAINYVGSKFSDYATSADTSSAIKAVSAATSTAIKAVNDKADALSDTVVKTTPQTLSDSDKNQVKENLGISNLSTPDWNALEGEAGYIENRTHYIKVENNPYVIKKEGAYTLLKNQSNLKYDKVDIHVVGTYLDYDNEDINIDGSVTITSSEWTEGANEYGEYDIPLVSDSEFRIYTTDGIIDVISIDLFYGGNLDINITTYQAISLDEKYIPDTIARKSDTELAKISYSDLKSLRDKSRLIPCQQYRITDYVTTTTQSNTQTAGHPFDVIVIADDVNVLNENARAIQHEDDTYFSNSDLNAWELKYCIDNDSEKFEWADTTNGKGVIYYMKDEYNNECPYDFKNIQFARWKLSNPVGYRNDYDFDNDEDNWILDNSILSRYGSLKEGFYGLTGGNKNFYYDDKEDYCEYKIEYTISNSPTYCYTFGKNTDYSLNGDNKNNVIKENYSYSSNKISLNNIVFLGNNCYNNTFGVSCGGNTFDSYCYSNTFGDDCYNNKFGYYCLSNTFGNDCCDNTFGVSCWQNTFGNDCYSNTFNYYFRDNTVGNSCSYNTFGNSCQRNTFGNYCSYNTFGNSCQRNTFGNYCDNNTFGNSCYCNIFGNSCYYNTLGASNTSPKSYYRYIIFDNGNSYINLNCTSTTSSTNYYQNVRIGLGVNNKTINDSNVGQIHETLYKPTNSQTITI